MVVIVVVVVVVVVISYLVNLSQECRGALFARADLLEEAEVLGLEKIARVLLYI